MTNKVQSSKSQKRYDWIEITGKFGEGIIEFAGGLYDTPVNRSLINQVVRSGTSIGANHMEADVAESRRDFNHKISLCKKEAKETTHWLRMVAKANLSKANKCRGLYQEAGN